MDQDQYEKVATAPGFIAALDQSGGSTPKALQQYGIAADAYANDAEMFDLMHAMRARIITSASFGGDRVLGAILFEATMDRQIEGRDTGEYLWNEKRIVPFLKVDKGLAEPADGVQLMQPIPGLAELLAKGRAKGMFGTKMRSVIKLADDAGIRRLVAQQFDLGCDILDAGLMPIIEPEVDITSPQKAEAEALLLAALVAHLDQLGADRRVMLKLTLPDHDDLFAELVAHPNVLRVVALSGGYSRSEACARLQRNRGLIASFSRALTEGLSAQQTDAEFDALLDRSIAEIFAASIS